MSLGAIFAGLGLLLLSVFVIAGPWYLLNNPGEVFCAIPHLVKDGYHRQALASMVGYGYD